MAVRDLAGSTEPAGNPPFGDPRRVVFFMAPGFSMMAQSSAIEPLRAVNRQQRHRRQDRAAVGGGPQRHDRRRGEPRCRSASA
jgi:transcriptional regulator GlxA family with amidase domain